MSIREQQLAIDQVTDSQEAGSNLALQTAEDVSVFKIRFRFSSILRLLRDFGLDRLLNLRDANLILRELEVHR